MPKLNHYDISSILNSEIVGPAEFGHGQINSLGDAQKYFDLVDVTHAPASLHANEEVPVLTVRDAFLAIRNARGDKGSSDLYIADPNRNRLFLDKCRELGIQASDYAINKRLMYARKNGYLRGLDSVKTVVNYEDYAFASEFAATELKYKTGASIDDILCDPELASQFDSIARRLAPGYTSFRYRWAILSIRKAGRQAEWKPDYAMPDLVGAFKLMTDPLGYLPEEGGVYLLSERERPLYARSTANIRHGVELHRKPQMFSAVTDIFWQPKVDDFIVRFAVLDSTKLFKPVERKLIEEKRPVFNVPRAAA
jgi:hypothetical protein